MLKLLKALFAAAMAMGKIEIFPALHAPGLAL